MSAPTAKKRTAKKVAAAVAVPATDDVDLEALGKELDTELRGLTTPGEDAPITEDGTINPVSIGKRGHKGPSMIKVFDLDGVDYFVPERPNPAVLLKYLRDSNPKGVRDPELIAEARKAAVSDMLMAVLGNRALDALGTSDEVSDEDVADVFAIVAHICFGAIEKIGAAVHPS